MPRSEQLDRALVGSIREPLLFLDFDRSTEQTTVKILKTLSRFESVGDLSEDTLYGVLTNDALRARLAAGTPDGASESDLIEAAILEEANKLEAALQAERQARAEDQRSYAADRDEASGLRSSVSQLRDALAEEKLAKERAVESLRETTAQLEARVKAVESERAEDARRRTDVRLAVGLAILAAGVLGGAAWIAVDQIGDRVALPNWLLWCLVVAVSTVAWLLVLDGVLRTRASLSGAALHRWLIGFRKKLIGILIALAISVAAALVYDGISTERSGASIALFDSRHSNVMPIAGPSPSRSEDDLLLRPVTTVHRREPPTWSVILSGTQRRGQARETT